MGRLLDEPMRVYRIAAPLLVVAFLVSGVGGGNDGPDEGAIYAVASTGWAVFGIVLVATVLFTLAVLAHSVRRRRSAVD